MTYLAQQAEICGSKCELSVMGKSYFGNDIPLFKVALFRSHLNAQLHIVHNLELSAKVNTFSVIKCLLSLTLVLISNSIFCFWLTDNKWGRCRKGDYVDRCYNPCTWMDSTSCSPLLHKPGIIKQLYVFTFITGEHQWHNILKQSFIVLNLWTYELVHNLLICRWLKAAKIWYVICWTHMTGILLQWLTPMVISTHILT